MRVLPIAMILALSGVPVWGVGFTQKACGFDMNRNGIIGEVADCNVCDGVTVDPDGDGTEEDLNYIDSVVGIDEVDCGAYVAPCATLGYVLAGANAAYAKSANGPLDGAEDILCISGHHVLIGTESVNQGGVAGAYEAAGMYPDDLADWGVNSNAGWEYPINPMMIVATDSDDDGMYPPFDSDDEAVISGDQGGGIYTLADAFNLNAPYIEMGHIAYEDFGRGLLDDVTSSGGFANVNSGASHVYIHDNRFDGINGEGRLYTARVLLGLFQGDSPYIGFVNNEVVNAGSFIVRGSCRGCEDFRFDYNTVLFNTLGEGNLEFFRPWDEMTRVSVTGNYVDANPDSFGAVGQPVVGGIAMSICTQDVRVRDNVLIDFRTPLYIRLTTNAGECQSRPVTASITGNVVINTYPGYTNNRFLTVEGGSGFENMYLQDLLFANNTGYKTDIADSSPQAILIWGGSDLTDFEGSYRIINNTLIGDWKYSAMSIGTYQTYHADTIVRHNIVSGEVDGLNIEWGADDAVLDSDHNVWDSDSGFKYIDTGYASLAEWQAGTGRDANSRECDPLFVSDTDAHLQEGDICAKDLGDATGGGVNIYVSHDRDGDPRPQGVGWDSGSDEYESGYEPPAPGTVLVSFEVVAQDPIDGDLSSSVVWDDNLDGPGIYVGAGPNLVLLSPGDHTLTAHVTNSRGDVLSDTVSFTVVLDPGTGSLTIIQPVEGEAYTEDAPPEGVGWDSGSDEVSDIQ